MRNVLKRIDPQSAELGMFIERFEGNWLNHPFWRRRFVIADAKQLAILHQSSVEAVIIDTSRGSCPAEEPPVTRNRSLLPTAASLPADRSPSVAPRPSIQPRLGGAVSLPSARQFGNAKRVVQRSTKIVSQVFLKARLGQAVKLGDVEPVIDDIYRSISDNPHALTAVLRCQRDISHVYRHALAVAALMAALGRAMRLPAERVRQAALVGLIMDIGVGQLQAMLDTVEGDYRALHQAHLDQHVFFGHDIVASLDGVPPECLRACLDHHEKLDGSGYPAGLSGDAIGEFARMAAICDEFDHLVSGGFQAPPMEPHDAIEELLRRWPEFDTKVLRAFQKSTGLYPIGTFVELRSGRLAMVVDLDPEDPDAPIVRTFTSWLSPSNARQTTIDLGRCYGADSITGVARPPGVTSMELQSLRSRLLEAAHRAAAQPG